jgi:antitoxin YefM
MYASYILSEEELNFDFFNSIKNTFKGKEIEISISSYDEIEYLLRSPENKRILLERINDLNNNHNLITFSNKECEKLF